MYDATPYLADHPGGAESILISAGMDATDEFNSIHSSKAKAMLAQYYIGELVASKPAEAAPPAANGHAAPAPAAVQVSPHSRSSSLCAYGYLGSTTLLTASVATIKW